MRIRFVLDGYDVEADVKLTDTLFRVLKDRLGVRSVHFGCGEGSCGACIVLVDGKPRYSCLTLAASVDGKKVTTAAGLRVDGELAEIQRAFVEHNAAQCGYCTPGMILVAKALLDQNQNPTDEEIYEALAGNLCRCTGYVPIVEAIKSLARR
jgi:Aerobic-type carbon monoxide dehydrogenase, small subunit CoxS/CutS homologs